MLSVWMTFGFDFVVLSSLKENLVQNTNQESKFFWFQDTPSQRNPFVIYLAISARRLACSAIKEDPRLLELRVSKSADINPCRLL